MDEKDFIVLINIVLIIITLWTVGMMVFVGIAFYKAIKKKPNGRSFKLIKVYPYSPKLGTIIFQKLNGFYDDNFNKAFNEEFLLKWSEYWEEIR